MAAWPDEKIRNIALWYIEKASMDPASWRFTLIGAIHPAVSEHCALQDGELPVVSSFISGDSWYLLTTRRIVGSRNGQTCEAASVDVTGYHVGNFKGYGRQQTDIMRLMFREGCELELEYETGKASMAPIHYMIFWKLKFPILDRLRFDPRMQSSSCPQCGKPLRTLEAQQCLHCGTDWHGKPVEERKTE